MKFSVSSNELNKALSAVVGAVPNKATLPILETILFETEEGNLKLTATDLEISIIETLPVEVEESGSVAIPEISERTLERNSHRSMEVDTKLFSELAHKNMARAILYDY